MNLTKKEREEVTKVYDTWLNSYLTGDVETYNSFFDDRYHFIGSTDNEDFLDRRETTKFLQDTADQLAGKVEIRNNRRIIEKFEGLIFVTELFDAYFLIENEWTYYGKFRFSSALKKNKEGLRFIYQHFSTPDTKAEEGETIGTEKIAAENLMLREAVKRRTVELEQKNRELEIESALERVRARTMAMQKSEELPQAANLLFQQVQSLGMPAWSAGYCLWDEDKKAITLFMSSEGVIQPALRMPLTEDPSLIHFKEAYERGESFYVEELGGEALKQHYEYLRTLPGVKESLEDIERAGFPVPTFQIFHVPYFSKGFLLFITYEPVPEAHEIFKRFAGVFEQTYTRFLDLKRAEEQTRESQIQLSLERVRARSMAMNSSEELSDVLSVLFEQFDILGIKPSFAHLTLFDEENDTFSFRMTGLAGQRILVEQIIDINKVEAWQSSYQQWKEGDKNRINCIDYPPEALPQIWEIMAEIFDALPEGSKMQIEDFPNGIYTTQGHCKFGYLGFNHTRKATEEEKTIVIRFATEFGRLYQRYLDIQKAEAQAREAQIEAALERIRNRALIMKDSSELNEVVSVFFNEFSQLDLLPPEARTYFCHIDTNKNEAEVWMTYTNGEVMSSSHITPLTKSASMKKYYEAWKRKDPICIRAYKGKNLDSYISFVSSLPHVKKDKDYKKLFKNPPKQIFMTDANFLQGNIGIMSFDPLSEEALEVLQRFAKVFEFTYTRFLDLKKAEAQAREAQIEAALERVRAASMAMHKSEELQMVVTVVFEQLQQLDFALDGAAFVATNFENFKSSDFWMEDKVTHHASCFKLPYYDAPSITDIYEAKAKSKDFVSKIYGKEKNIWFKYAFENTDLKIVPEDRKKWILQQTHLTQAFAIEKNSMIGIHAHHAKTLSKSEIDILKRFSKVFEQGYTRFLDLQKAEAQAREAEIEASLERIRSRTMGMQSSDELSEVGSLVFQQMKELGIQAVSSWFWFIDKTKDEIEIWTTHDVHLGKPVKVLAKDYWTFKEEIEAWKKKEPFYKLKLPQNDFVQILKEIFGIKIKQQKGVEHIHLLQTYHKFGFLGLGTKTEATKQEMEISARFAKVFEQTYTRFLDLKKAEAQARESQIEAALERVRARSMAMHNSEELLDVAQQLYQELENLGVPQYMTGFVEVDKANQKQKVWITAPNGERIESFYLPLKGDSILKTRYNSWVKREPIFYQNVSGDTLKKHLLYVSKHYESAEAVEIGNQFPNTIIFYCGNFSEGYLHILSEVKLDKEQESILQKFTKVFSITYRRFLDLKLAEEQAREAQIEAGLERVRAKTMAMHQSEELAETASVLFNELKKLGIESIRSGVGIIDYEADTAELWLVTETDGKAERKILGKINAEIHPLYRQWFDAGRKNIPYFIEEMEGEGLRNYYETVSAYWQLPIPAEFNHKEVYHGFFFPEGTINVITLKKLSEAECNTLVRFAKVFGLLYRRFLDLQNAEAQAREAKVEAALERVRARTMAMHKGNELADTAKLLFDQITGLGIKPRSCGFLIMNNETKTF